MEHSFLNVAESIPRKQVFPLSHPSTTQNEEYNFLPSSASEASLIAVNTCKDQQLLDQCVNRDFSKLSLKQPKIAPLPPSAFEYVHPNAPREFPRETSQTDMQHQQYTNEITQTDKQQQSVSELMSRGVKLKDLTLQEEILHIKNFLKKYYSIKEKLRYI